MQVTDEMVEAAAMRLWYGVEPPALYGDRAPREALRDAIQAALDAMPKATGGVVPGPVSMPRAGCAGEGYMLPPGAPVNIPAGATITVNLGGDMLPTPAGATRIVRTKPQGGDTAEPEDADVNGPQPPADMPDLESMPGRLDLREAGGPLIAYAASGRAAIVPEPIPVTEPRPGSTIDDIAAVIGHHRQVVLEWIADRNLGRPRFRFPEPVVTTGDVERDLYDLDAVKAWYDGLPQAADG